MKVLLAVLLAFYVITYFHRVMTGVMKSEIDQIALESNTDPDLLLAVLSSAYFYAYTLAQLFVGILIDSFGIKRVGSLFAILMLAGSFMMYLMSPYSLILGRAVVGFSCATAFLAYQRATSLNYSREMQGRLTSYALVVGNLSAMVATYPLRLALNTIGLKAFLEVMMVATLVVAILLYLVTEDTGLSTQGNKLVETLSHFKHLVRDRHIWGLSMASVATYGVTLAYQSAWGQKLLTGPFGLSLEVSSQYLMILALTFTLTSPIAGFLSDSVLARRKPVIVLATLTSTASWALMLYATQASSTEALRVSLILLGIASGLHIVAPPMAKEGYDTKYSATSVALFNVILFSTTAVIQTISTLLDPRYSIVIQLIIAVAGATLVTAFARETLKKN